MKSAEHRVGAWTVVKVNELDLNDFTAEKLLPDLTPDAFARMPGREDPRIYDPETDVLQRRHMGSPWRRSDDPDRHRGGQR